MSGAYTDCPTCPKCTASSDTRVVGEHRGNFIIKQCGAEMIDDRRGCGYTWEETSTWAREKKGVGNVNHAGASRGGVLVDLSTLPDDWHARIFGKKEA